MHLVGLCGYEVMFRHKALGIVFLEEWIISKSYQQTFLDPKTKLIDKKISASFPMNNVCACNHCKLCDQYLSMKICWIPWWNQISFHKLLQSSIPCQINKDKIHHRIGIWTTRIKVLYLLPCMLTYLTISCHLFP